MFQHHFSAGDSVVLTGPIVRCGGPRAGRGVCPGGATGPPSGGRRPSARPRACLDRWVPPLERPGVCLAAWPVGPSPSFACEVGGGALAADPPGLDLGTRALARLTEDSLDSRASHVCPHGWPVTTASHAGRLVGSSQAYYSPVPAPMASESSPQRSSGCMRRPNCGARASCVGLRAFSRPCTPS